MMSMTAAMTAIEKVINTSSKKPTKSEAEQILRSCGILDRKNNIKGAYKKILVVNSENNESK